jgi:hypothetical protein
MNIKLSASARERLLVIFCTVVCGSTAMIAALGPFTNA